MYIARRIVKGLIIEPVGILPEKIGEPPCPSLPRQAVSYAKAKTRDLLAGRPRRTHEECARIVRDICEPCEWFRASDRKCSKCGCPVGVKIPLKREHCPLIPPKW